MLGGVEIDTPHGPARVHVQEAEAPRAALVLGHGAGGSVEAPDLQAAAQVAASAGATVVLVEQPYRVAGRRSPPRAAVLDAAWLAIVEQLPLDGLSLITGGRSSGARVACRTAAATGSIGVLCLAFPLVPPGNRPSRQPELDAVSVPVLIVQGESDSFGMPRPAGRRTVARIRGTHALKSDVHGLRGAVAAWLDEVMPPRPA
jgi:predicted alpha/beta-hydrolase family hydrolase